jgi:hypothetical protein
MKTLAIIVAVLLSVQLAFSNDGKYLETMQKNIQSVYTAQTIPDLQSTVNTFERIAAAEKKTKWEPFYYASFGYIMMSTREADNAKKDAYLDLADGAIKEAKAIVANESEIVALEGFIQMMRINVDPASRGQQYSGLAMQSFGTALGINPENPRALALMAQMQFGTAQFFKSSTAEACGMAAKAKEKFTTYKSTNPLAPQWGRDMNEGLLGQCK